MTDTERLDFLEWLQTRTEFQNQRVPDCQVRSDMHFGMGYCNLYVRNLFGNPVAGGSGAAQSVREAIDTVAGKIADRSFP